jgi:hypothetical protein
MPSSGIDNKKTESLPDGDYRFTIKDSYGDGICCSYGVGSYKLTDLGANWAFASGGEFESSERKQFSVVNGAVVLPQPPTTTTTTTAAPPTDPVTTTTASTTSTSTTTASTTAATTTTTTSTTTTSTTAATTTSTTATTTSPASPSVVVDMKVKYDYYYEETSFKLHKKTGPTSWTLIHSQPAPSTEPIHPSVTVSVDLEPGEYRFKILDSFGDGICCDYGNGYYQLSANGSVFASGGNYGVRDLVFFTVVGSAAADASSSSITVP